MSLTLKDFDFNLPECLIAQEPVRPRDHSRLLVLDKNTGQIEHKHFYDIVDYLQAGDVLVMNNSKVIRARLQGTKDTGGKVEVFLLRKIAAGPCARGDQEVWECMPNKKFKQNLKINFDQDYIGEIIEDKKIKFNKPGITEVGETPLPPYIKKKAELEDYQTVYAKEEGSVAAPTAGLHFTPELLQKLKDKGVRIEEVTLHVGLGTFAPVREEDITKHEMHSEYVVSPGIKKTGRIICVGTTSARTIESLGLEAGSKWTDIFIYPGYKFKHVDCLITNFHLPKSSLMMLVSALAGQENIKHAYKEAIKEKYRFYSFGDAMLIK